MTAGAMDLEDQWAIMRVIREYGDENLVVMLGCQDTESTQTHAETVTLGDPSLAGPLAGTSLSLPVYHILEPEIKNYFSQNIKDTLLKPLEKTIDVESICSRMQDVRTKAKCRDI